MSSVSPGTSRVLYSWQDEGNFKDLPRGPTLSQAITCPRQPQPLPPPLPEGDGAERPRGPFNPWFARARGQSQRRADQEMNVTNICKFTTNGRQSSLCASLQDESLISFPGSVSPSGVLIQHHDFGLKRHTDYERGRRDTREQSIGGLRSTTNEGEEKLKRLISTPVTYTAKSKPRKCWFFFPLCRSAWQE